MKLIKNLKQLNSKSRSVRKIYGLWFAYTFENIVSPVIKSRVVPVVM